MGRRERRDAGRDGQTSRAGPTRCLGGCGRTFESPDRVAVRLCDGCKARNAGLSRRAVAPARTSGEA